MRITIQAVREREEQVNKLLDDLGDAEVYWDERRISPFDSFKQMLQLPIEGHRLHLQDDIIIADNLVSYLPHLEEEVIKRDIDVLSLYAPNRKTFNEYQGEDPIIKFDRFLWMQAVIFSPFAINGLRTFIETYPAIKSCDFLVQEYLRDSRNTAYVHIPSLVQHNVWLGSTIGHHNNERRMSKTFDKHFITKALKA